MSINNICRTDKKNKKIPGDKINSGDIVSCMKTERQKSWIFDGIFSFCFSIWEEEKKKSFVKQFLKIIQIWISPGEKMLNT